jgi:hypothetical protein
LETILTSPDFPADDELKQTETMNETILNARNATEKEHNMTLMQGVRLYPKAIAWSMLISTCIVMEGFDVALVNNVCLRRTSKKRREMSDSNLSSTPLNRSTASTASTMRSKILGRFLLHGKPDSATVPMSVNSWDF